MIYRLFASAALTLGFVSVAAADSGVVVQEDTPSCDHFIIETRSGYTLAERYGGVISIWTLPYSHISEDLRTGWNDDSL